MGKCIECGKDTGWFGEKRCEEHLLRYGQNIEIKNGFYQGQKGIIMEEGEDCATGSPPHADNVKCYKIKLLSNNMEIWVNDWNLE